MLKFLVIFFSIIYIIGLLVRWFIKRWFVSLSQQNQKKEPQNARKEGEVTIDYSQNTDRKLDAEEGEYIDYEDIK